MSPNADSSTTASTAATGSSDHPRPCTTSTARAPADSTAARLLRAHGLDLERTRADVERLIAERILSARGQAMSTCLSRSASTRRRCATASSRSPARPAAGPDLDRNERREYVYQGVPVCAASSTGTGDADRGP
jgi:hypothetical protein